MAAKEHIYRVSFKEAIDGRTDYFYGSLSAIYSNFTPEEIGCKLYQLWRHKVDENNPYIGARCTITKEHLTRKKHKI